MENGVSLEHQKERLVAWVLANGHEIGGVYVETGSGSTANNRPELQKAMQAVCKSKGVLVVYSLSRFSRSVVDTLNLAAQLEKADAHLASLTESIDTSSAVGRMVFRMLSTLNQFEREMLVERTTNALGHMRRQNKLISGSIPYGYTLAADGETLLPAAAEQEVINRIAQQRAAGQTLAAIADQLNDAGVTTKKLGKTWYGSTVASILNRQQKLAA